MALPAKNETGSQFQGLTNLPVLRQLGLMIGLAASVAIGVAAVMWTQKPDYGMLYSGLSEKDTGLIIEALQKENVSYQLGGGAILVPSDNVHDMRIKLAAQGLPKGTAVGFESLNDSSGFGVSQFMENARYYRALEVELARSITTLNNVQNARIHLAIPKQTTFLRDSQKPSASVLVNLYPGRQLEEEQVAAITHLVSSSVPSLEVSQVTVADQRGRLLTGKEHSQGMALSAAQFDYSRRLEKSYIDRIENILSPIAGNGAVRAQVSADVDFTLTEQTQESYNPDESALRSSQTIEEQTSGSSGGVPGALSNEPPGNATAPEQAAGGTGQKETTVPNNSRRKSIKNYELDRTISHTRLGSGRVKRLSVAVVIDDKVAFDDKGEATRTPYSPEELDRFTGLVKEAVGYNAQRGDSVSVINVPFNVPQPAEPIPEPVMWKQSWFQDIIKKVIGGIIVLVLLFGVLRPILKMLAQQAKLGKAGSRQLVAAGGGDSDDVADDTLSLSSQSVPKLSPPSESSNMKVVKAVVEQDPKLAAQVVKNWVSNEN